MHLLDPGYIPALGIGAWWTLFMLNVHAVWSISTSIALVEGCVPSRSTSPWLKTPGLIVTGALFVLGSYVTTRFQLTNDPFRASTAQFAIAAAVCIGLIGVAFVIPKSFPRGDYSLKPMSGVVILTGFLLGVACLLIPKSLGWGAFGIMFGLDVVAFAAVVYLARSQTWGVKMEFCLAVGAALAYGLHAFIETPVAGGLQIGRIGNAIFFAVLLGIIGLGFRRLRVSEPSP